MEQICGTGTLQELSGTRVILPGAMAAVREIDKIPNQRSRKADEGSCAKPCVMICD